MNRAIAIGELEGPECGLAALDAIDGSERLAAYPFYPAARAELELRRGERRQAERHFRSALALARNDAERRFLKRRMRASADA